MVYGGNPAISRPAHIPHLRHLQDDERRELLQLSEAQLEDVARFCNRYPDIQMAHQVTDAEDVHAGEQVQVTVQLEREMTGDVLRPVDAGRCDACCYHLYYIILVSTKTTFCICCTVT